MSGGVDLSVDLCGLHLRNPVLLASGTCGYGQELEPYLDLSALGGLVTKGISTSPRLGNPTPRVTETAAGMLNAIGLQNVGVSDFEKEKLPWLRSQDTARLVNVYGTDMDGYVDVVERLTGVDGVDGFELNISCPNVKAGGLELGTYSAAVSTLVGRVRRATRLPLLVKLTPNVTDVTGIARVAADAGADALTLINTLRGMAIDAAQRRPVLANVYGGLSGPAIKPVALAMVHRVSRAVSVPIVGVGGIMSGQDAAEFLLAGATAVQVGTATLVEPTAAKRVVTELEQWCELHQIAHVRDLVGALLDA